jgi:AraC-like DNA-binding protein
VSLAHSPGIGFQKPTACITLRGARAAYVGPSLDLAPHRNAAATIAIALHTPFRLAFGDSAKTLGLERDFMLSLIPSGVWHHLQAEGQMAFLYLDPVSADQRRLQARSMQPLTAAERTAISSSGAINSVDLIGRILDLWPHAPPPSDPRIADLVSRIGREPQDYPTLAIAADSVGLSPSRCNALLTQHLGMPFRRYRLWRRMGKAMREIAAGANLTAAAHATGFNSSAHFSSAYRAMFGLAPSALLSLGVGFDMD